ncbi:recombinase zinc beta ribbon domain-containing protein [Urbifossiella limnaea]|uniref:Recombinase domain-containing protein n=1 Tax=Urbifossiella limnaea TaxID=2528023 RepID=A0A517XWD0_9BACT|nr:recombinase family protein [Urbifossiella limnaea]QDU21816.1 hypothetical protein ETAA1_37890 [Urbifossiella limnaea]
MLDRKYDPTQPYRYVRYGRMSGKSQNPKSPEQQFETIEDVRTRSRYPWVLVKTYRDDAITGRLIRRRRGLQTMLQEIELGLVRVDLIAVDTMERLGRAGEIAEIRRKLLVEHGVMVVAADNDFCDPTGVVGAAVGMVEQMRSTEHTRISRHNVLRGKKFAASLKRWPGGPPPFGYRLKSIVDDSADPPEVYSVLEIDPPQADALRLAYHRAVDTGEGDLLLARWWNASPGIPAEFKPVSPFTMGYRLRNPISIGVLKWGVNRTGIVSDVRVVERNPDGPKVIDDFCPPLIEREIFDRFMTVRNARRQAAASARARTMECGEDVKRIAPQVRGLTLKYPLTGLVRCGGCRASMRPVLSGRKSKAGKTYTYYTCPRHYDGSCDNAYHVPEVPLRRAVVERLRARLFPPPDRAGEVPDWLPELMAEVRRELDHYRLLEPDRTAEVRKEREQIEKNLAGWGQSLGNPALPGIVRSDLEARYASGKLRLEELYRDSETAALVESSLQAAVGPETVLAQLRTLHDVLGTHNPTLTNLELANHIDRITCHRDGRVELRGTWLGLFAGATELLTRSAAAPAPPETCSAFPAVNPRRRGRLRVPSLSASSQDAAGDGDTSLDPGRFDGLRDGFFWSEPVTLEGTKCWSERHAAEVATLRKEGWTHERLASHFKKTVPTVRKALKFAAAFDGSLGDLPRKQPRARWPEQNYREVALLRRAGKSLTELCAHFEKCEPLIRTALRLAKAADA